MSSRGRRCSQNRGRACGIRRTVPRFALEGNCAIITRFRARWSTDAQMLIGVDVETALSSCCEKVMRWRKPGCRRCRPGTCYSEHGFGRADVAGRLAGVPVVHGGVEVQAGIGRGPGGIADLFPEIARLQRFCPLSCWCGRSGSSRHRFPRTQEIVLQRDRVVGVLGRRR